MQWASTKPSGLSFAGNKEGKLSVVIPHFQKITFKWVVSSSEWATGVVLKLCMHWSGISVGVLLAWFHSRVGRSCLFLVRSLKVEVQGGRRVGSCASWPEAETELCQKRVPPATWFWVSWRWSECYRSCWEQVLFGHYPSSLQGHHHQMQLSLTRLKPELIEQLK